MDAGDFRHRNGKHAEGIVPAKVVLDRERKAAEVAERLQVFGSDTRRVEGGAVMRDALIGPPERAPQAFQLQTPKLGLACRLDRLRVAHPGKMPPAGAIA